MSTYGAAEMAAAFRLVRKNTVQIAEEIPEEKYSFVAAPGARPVAALLTHMAVAPGLHEDIHGVKHVTTLQGYDFAGIIGRANAEEQKPRSKAAIVGMLTSEGERFAAWLESLSPAFLAENYTNPMGLLPKTRLEGLLSIKEHEMHHRGQLMLIQRMLGITPHLTRQMQERLAAHAATAAGAGAAAAAG